MDQQSHSAKADLVESWAAKPIGLGQQQGGRRLGEGTSAAQSVYGHATSPQPKSSSQGKGGARYQFSHAPQELPGKELTLHSFCSAP